MPANSRHYVYQNIEFWAERGIIFLLDKDRASKSEYDGRPDEVIITISPGELVQRAIAIRQYHGESCPHEQFMARKLLEQAVIVAKIAQQQGDPHDPRVTAHIRRHRRRNSIIMGDAAAELPPLAGIRYRVNVKDPRSTLLHGVNVTPDLSIPGSGPVFSRRR